MRVTRFDVGRGTGSRTSPRPLAPSVRAGLARRLAAAQLPRVEAVSFVNPERVPQMAGAEEVVAAVGDVDAELSGLVLNERGWERLAATTLDRVNVTLAATETFNQRDGNATLEEATARVERILDVVWCWRTRSASRRRGRSRGSSSARSSSACPSAGTSTTRLRPEQAGQVAK